MILADPLPESMINEQSFFNFLQISFASPTRMVNSQSLSFLARISVSFNFTSCFHCRSAVFVLLNSPKLLLVLARDSFPFLPDLRFVVYYSCLVCLERKLEILLSTFLQKETLFNKVSKLTNSTPSAQSCLAQSELILKFALVARSRNYYRVRQSLVVFQKSSRSRLLRDAKSSNR